MAGGWKRRPVPSDPARRWPARPVETLAKLPKPSPNNVPKQIRKESPIMTTATDADIEVPPAQPIVRPLLLPLLGAAVCVALADWLFYGHDAGLSFALFLAALGITVMIVNPARATRPLQ